MRNTADSSVASRAADSRSLASGVDGGISLASGVDSDISLASGAADGRSLASGVDGGLSLDGYRQLSTARPINEGGNSGGGGLKPVPWRTTNADAAAMEATEEEGGNTIKTTDNTASTTDNTANTTDNIANTTDKQSEAGEKELAMATDGGKARAAFFDLDGTIVSSNIVMQYAVARLAHMPLWIKCLWVPYYAVKCVMYLAVDACNRSVFNRLFVKDFRGMPAGAQVKGAMAALIHDRYLAQRVFPAAVAAVALLKRNLKPIPQTLNPKP